LIDKLKHKKQTISGLRWTVLNQVITQAVSFGLGIFLMTLLPPTSFGLLGMVTVFSGFLSVFKDFGLGSSIIQRKNITNQDLDTVFWVTVALGVFLTILLMGLSPIIATYYKEPKLVNISIGLSFLFIIQSLSSIHLSLLKKKMRFKFLFKINVTATLLAGITALVMAYLDYGVWALVAQQLINATLLTILLFAYSNYTPKIQFHKKILNSHMKFSVPLVGRGSVNYWARNADNFLIGKFLGAELLGIYTRSYSIMMLPVSRISGVISSVMFPSLSIIQDDKERVNTIFLKITRTIAFITFPLMAMLALSVENFVKLFFTKEWYQMIPILQILASVGAIQSLGTLNGNIFLLKAKTSLDFKLTLFNSIVYVIVFIITSQYNLMLLVSAYLIASVTLIVINWIFVARIMNLSFYQIVINILPHIIFYSLIVISGLVFIDLQFFNTNLLNLILILIYVAIIWTLMFFLFQRKELFGIIKIVKSFILKN
jgi:PST family polysaccharide transporter